MFNHWCEWGIRLAPSLLSLGPIKEALPVLCYQLIIFAHLAQFQPATRTQLPKAGFPAPMRSPISDLSATVTKHAGKFGHQFKMGFLPKPNTGKIISLEALWISGISTMHTYFISSSTYTKG